MSDSADEEEVRAHAASLAGDLRAWLEWAHLTGATEVPSEQREDKVQAVPSPVAPVESPPPRLLIQRPASVPVPRVSPKLAASHASPPPPTGPIEPGEAGLRQLTGELGDCQRCRLGRERKKIVFGVGNPRASLVIVGEAPGEQEDLTGEPFVGRSGQLLTRMLNAIQLSRDEVYICNVIKCRPPQNRDPLPDEIATCSPFLHRQIQAIQPRVLLTLGRFAAVNLMGTDLPMGELRKRTGELLGVPIVSTYHPSYLLRSPKMKKQAWEDFLSVRRLLRRA
jgi:uracil-DNA glycosylase family 4